MAFVAIVALTVTVVVHAVADSTPCDRQRTIGDLAHALAQAAEAAGPQDARIAEQVLRSVHGNPSDPLTEGAAAAVLKTAGVCVTTPVPGRLMAPGRVRAHLRRIEGTFQPETTAGRSLSSEVSSTSIDDCFELRTLKEGPSEPLPWDRG